MSTPIPPHRHATLRRLKERFRRTLWRVTGLSIIDAKIDRLEALSHGTRATYLGDHRVLVRVVVEGVNIAFIVEAQDKLLTPWFMATGAYETDLTTFLVKNLRPDSHCIDVGANFGYFTCLMARFCPEGRVIGVEADRHVFELLRDNILINGFHGRAGAWHAAISDVKGRMLLYRRTGRSGNTSIAPVDASLTDAFGEPPVTPFETEAIRLDDLADELQGRVDFIKVDVEGAEPLVFRGGAVMISRNPQAVIVMEWSPGQIRHAGFDLSDFLDDLAKMDLRPFDLQDGAEVALSFSELANLEYRAGVVLRTVRP